MTVRYSWSALAGVCLAAALGCHKHNEPASTAVPVITSFSPASGIAGPANATIVTVNGSGFDGTTEVSLGGAVCSFNRVNYNTITFMVPYNAMSGPIGIVNGLGSVASTQVFNVQPYITTFTPASGGPGTSVLMTGYGLGNITSVTFGGGPKANIYLTGANQLQAVVPWGSSTGLITVTASDGTQVNSLSNFTYTGGTVSAPAIAGFTPAQGPVGTTSITLTGSGFSAVQSVTVGGVGAYFTLVDDGTLTVQVPQGAVTGPVQVTSYLGSASTASAFTVAPAITSFTPSQGAAGTLVTLQGSGFVGATSVAFGNAALSNFIVTSANTAQANVAAGSATGPVSLTSSGIACQSSGSFTFLADAAAAPAIASFAPAQALTGATVTLTGTGFTGVTAVAVGGVPAPFQVAGDTQITLTVPAAAQTGFLSATNALGVAGSPGAFTVLPTITSISPASGPVGTQVTITGTGFGGTPTPTSTVGTSAVAFGGVNAQFVVVDANHVTATVPAGAVSGAITLTSSGQTCQSGSNAQFTVTQ